jgi:hypothetical protein
MLNEFEEGTLLSLLEDSDLFSYLQDYPLSPIGDPGAVGTVDTASDDLDLSELFGGDLVFAPIHGNSDPEAMDVSTKDVLTQEENPRDPQSSPEGDLQTHSGSETDVSSIDSNDSDTAEESFSFDSQPTKRRKIETKINSSERDRLFLSACVDHDHCYTRVSSSEQLESPGGRAEKDGSLTLTTEEGGNNSDAGYETMSSSTSPGGSAGNSRSPHSSPKALQTSPLLPPSALPPLTTPQMNPVALIDARIKHFMRSQQVSLTEEEKETLRAEGLPIPTTLPLTKVCLYVIHLPVLFIVYICAYE